MALTCGFGAFSVQPNFHLFFLFFFLGAAFISQTHFRESGPVFYHTRVRSFLLFIYCFYSNVFMLWNFTAMSVLVQSLEGWRVCPDPKMYL